MHIRQCVLTFSCFFVVTKPTIDVNIPEFEYLADNLRPEECRRLVTTLHFKTYEEPNAADQAENKIPKDLTCLQLLLHWNSERGEGRGESHEEIARRLTQIGREDLARWLSKTVFHQLSKELNRSLDDPFKDIKTEKFRTTLDSRVQPTLVPVVVQEDVTIWTPFDTICSAFILMLGIIIIGAFVVLICTLLRARCSKRRRVGNSTSRYEEVETDDTAVSDV